MRTTTLTLEQRLENLKAYQAAYRLATKHQWKQYHKEYYQRNKERLSAYQHDYNMRKKGIYVNQTTNIPKGIPKGL
jgi:hypothetical protein